MQFIETPISGCYEIIPKVFGDTRGNFVKVFHKDLFLEKKLETTFAESFYSTSKQNVIRGLHFQLPPNNSVKLVYCISGKVLDVLVDLRKKSKSYGIPYTFNLSSKKANILYIPEGIAHGFYVLSELAIMVYSTTKTYDEKRDSGILWNSFNIWPTDQVIVSEKDSELIPFKDFVTPF